MADAATPDPVIVTTRDVWLEVRALREDLAEQHTSQALTSQQVTVHTTDLASHAARLTTLESWRLRVLGAAAAVSAIVGAVIALAAAAMQTGHRP